MDPQPLLIKAYLIIHVNVHSIKLRYCNRHPTAHKIKITLVESKYIIFFLSLYTWKTFLYKVSMVINVKTIKTVNDLIYGEAIGC